MASNISDFRSNVQSRIRDTAGKLSGIPTTGDLDKAILAAVEQFSKDRPQEKAARVQGNGSFKYQVDSQTPNIAGFADGAGKYNGFSRPLRVAYPHLTTDQIPTWLPTDEFGLEPNEAGLFLWFYRAKPSASEYFLVVFTAPHVVDANSSSVPSSNDEAVSDLAAAFAFEKLAAYYTEGTVIIDNTIQLSKSREFRENAKVFRARYDEKLQIGPKARLANSAVAAGIAPNFRDAAGSDYHFHGRNSGGTR